MARSRPGAGPHPQLAGGLVAVAVMARPVGGAAVAIKALARKRLIHQAVAGRALVQQADQRAPQRQSRDKTLGAVDGIEHPDIFGLFVARAEFLADDAVAGKSLADQAAHGGFGGAVGLGHGIEGAAGILVLQREGVPEEGHDRLARHRGEPLHKRYEINRRHAVPPDPCGRHAMNRGARPAPDGPRRRFLRARVPRASRPDNLSL